MGTSEAYSLARARSGRSEAFSLGYVVRFGDLRGAHSSVTLQRDLDNFFDKLQLFLEQRRS